MNRTAYFISFFLLVVAAFPFYAQNGIVKTYYEDGSIESELSYVNDILDGVSIFYFPNGNIREEISISYGKAQGIHKKYFPNGLIKEERSKKEGMLDGISKIYFENGALKQMLNYENGLLIKKIDVPYDPSYSAPIESFLAGNRQYKLSKDSNIVSDTEISPVPINGIKDIQNKLVYPKDAIDKRIEGVVTLSLKVDTAGKSSEIQVVKSLSNECDIAAINSVDNTKFLPGKNANKAVNSKIILNVTFKLEDKVIAKIDDVQKIRKEIEEIIKPELKKSGTEKKTIELPKQISKPETKIELPKQNISNPQVVNVVTDENNLDPMPIGGTDRVFARMHIPGKAIELKIEGEVTVKVEVDKYGVVRDTKVIKGLGYGIDEAIEVAILDSPFKPGKIKGEPVKATVVLSIPFTYKK